MGHGSDKLYITHGEHASGDHSASSTGARDRRLGGFARLPFDCCALTLKPFDTPVATAEGTIYDLLAIIPFLRQHGTDPVTGRKLTSGELIKLNFYKNGDGQYHDPVTFKIFNEHTPLVAIKTTGNVFSRESIDRLNIKPGHWQDLITDEKFTRADLITLQDPLNIQQRDLSQFDYIKKDLKVDESANGVGSSLKGINVDATGVGRVLKKIADKTDKAKLAAAGSSSTPASTSESPTTLPLNKAKSNTPYNTSTVSTNLTAASLTSTSASISTSIENALWHEEDLMYEQVVKRGEKAFVRLVTNFGNLNLELYADKAPRTVYNFLKLAENDKYKDTVFHRLIPGFMLQGGDPTGTGRGGSSFWGKPFEDEYNARRAYKHEERGTVSMANSGPNTNSSQFFITFRPTPHLDGKHTVFGRLVGGDDVLSKIERVPVDTTDRPLKQVILRDVAIFQDPFAEYQKRLEKRLQREEEERVGEGVRAKKREEREKDRTTWFGTQLEKKKGSGKELEDLGVGAKGGVGKYVAPTTVVGMKRVGEADEGGSTVSQAAKKRQKGGFGDFAGW